MIFYRHNTHVVSTLMIFAAAVFPIHPLATTGAYRDIESSVGNTMRAAECFKNCLEVQLDEFVPEAFTISTLSLEQEVAGTSTASTTREVEVSDEPLTIEEPPPADTEDTHASSTTDVEISNEPLTVTEPEKKKEVVETKPEEQKEEEKKEETPEPTEIEDKPEVEKEEAPEPQSEDPAPPTSKESEQAPTEESVEL